MSRSKRFIHSVFFGYSYQALVVVTGLWLTPFLLRHLGQHDYGLWLTALQIMVYLGLVDFGIVALLPRTLAYATGRAGSVEKATDLPHIVGQTAVIVLAQTPLVAVAAVVAWFLLPHEWMALRGPLAVIMSAFVIFFPLRMFGAVLEGLQEQAFVNKAGMASWSIGTGTNIVLILSGFGLYAIALGWILSQTASAAACAYRLWKRHPEVLPSRLPRLSRPELFSKLGRGFWMSANQLGQVLMAGTDVLVISKVLGPAMVVPYACTGKLAGVLSNQPVMLMHLATPGLSEMRTGASKERLYEVMIALGQGMLLLTGLLVCVIIAVNKAFVHWWVGGLQYGGLTLTCLVLLQILIRHWNLTFAYTAFSFGHEKLLAIAGFFDGLVTASAMLLMVSRFGYIGVVAGSIAGVCLTSLPANLFIVARELNLSIQRLAAPFWPWFWRCALLATGCALLAKNWTPKSPVQIVLIGAVVALVYCAVQLGPVLKSPLGPYLHRGVDNLQAISVRLQSRVLIAPRENA